MSPVSLTVLRALSVFLLLLPGLVMCDYSQLSSPPVSDALVIPLCV